MQVRRVTAGIAAATAAVTLAACTGGAGAVSAANAAAVISIGIAEPTHLIPTDTTDASGIQVLTALFTPLVTFDKGGKPVPDQAESITTTDSGSVTAECGQQRVGAESEVCCPLR